MRYFKIYSTILLFSLTLVNLNSKSSSFLEEEVPCYQYQEYTFETCDLTLTIKYKGSCSGTGPLDSESFSVVEYSSAYKCEIDIDGYCFGCAIFITVYDTNSNQPLYVLGMDCTYDGPYSWSYTTPMLLDEF